VSKLSREFLTKKSAVWVLAAVLMLAGAVRARAQAAENNQNPNPTPDAQGQAPQGQAPQDQAPPPVNQNQPLTQTQDQNQVNGEMQNQGDTAEQGMDLNQGNEGGSTVNTSARVPVPLPLNIDASSLEFTDEQERRNFVRAGVTVGANYDDNLLSAPQTGTPEGGAVFSAMPNIMLDQARTRLAWTVNYAGGFMVNQRISSYNQGSHNAGVDLRYRLSPHVNVHVRDNYVITTGFFEQFQAGNGAPLAGALTQPNQAVITPLARHNDDLGTAEITWQFSAGDMVGATSTFYDSRYRDITNAGPGTLLDTRTYEGDGFYTHRVTETNWAGLVYKFQRLQFGTVDGTVTPASPIGADTNSFLLFDTINLKPNMVLSLFAGPEYTTLNDELLTGTSTTLPGTWGTAGGASYAWNGQRTSIRATGLRRVSDGGGMLAAVELISGSAAVRRQMRRTSTLELGMVYGDSRELGAEPADLKSASVSVDWEQRFARDFTASMGYARDFQQGSLLAGPLATVNHNRGWIAISYEFSRPFGR